MIKKNNQDLFLNIHILRYIASLMIVVLHFNGTFLKGDLNIDNQNYILSSGVDMFFIISGFLMFILIEKRKYKFKQFLVTRLSKIVPIYYAVTILLFLGDNFLNIFPRKDILISDLIKSLTFSNIFFENGETILAVGWTLEYEVIFYFIVALSILFKFNIRNSAIFITSSILFLCVILKSFLFLEFLFGGLAFFVVKYKLYQQKNILSFILFGSIFLFLLDGRYIVFGIPMFGIFLISFLINKKYPIKFLPLNLSYEVYIYHILIIRVLDRIGFMSNFSYSLNLLFTILITFLISYISNVVEKNIRLFFLNSNNLIYK